MVRIVIDKAARRLTLYDGEGNERVFPVALGGCPRGAKCAEGDQKTPEGRYAVCTRNENSRFHLSLGLNYPAPEDALAALTGRRISLDQYRAICQAAREGRRPPWDTPLGGYIMIHGGGTEGDWTAGCVALSDADMDAIWPHCAMGTEVVIVPGLNDQNDVIKA